jgi:hypothetical protein
MDFTKRRMAATGLSAVLLLLSCSRQTMDRAIKGDIATKAKTEIAFAGVNYTVADGVVNLSGACPSPKEKSNVETTVQKIAGVKKVVNNISLSPVLLDENFSLKQSVDSVLKDYNLVTAQLQNKQVVLTGQAGEKEAQELTKSLQQLPVSGIENRLSIH